jgi:formylglycine-generating enzyme required for sulfatase activity
VVLVVGILGVSIWLRSQEMNWNVLRIWTMAQFGFYDGPMMVQIPGGTFQMGYSDCAAVNADEEYSDQCPRRRVAIQSFEIGQYEVTFDEYSAFVLGTDVVEIPHDKNWGRGSRPVINVSWNDAKEYIVWLSRVTGKIYRLPTEAEWEYAVRAGTTTTYSFGDDPRKLNEYGWYKDNSENQTHPVGQKKPNKWDLYDMHGNVSELVEDDWFPNSEGAPDDGRAWVKDPRSDSGRRVARGGYFDYDARYSQSSRRFRRSRADLGSRRVGFRLARSVALGP